MQFTNALHALLVLGLFQQADAQNTVTVTIRESGSDVVMQLTGSLAVLPSTTPYETFFGFASTFWSRPTWTYVSLASNIDCTYQTDFISMTTAVVVYTIGML